MTLRTSGLLEKSAARVLLIECSFLFAQDRDHAREYAHIHLDDLVARAELFRNEAVVLTYFSQRYRPEEIREALCLLPPPLAACVVPFLPGYDGHSVVG